MNVPLLLRLLGIIALLIAASMAFSLPWAHPALGAHAELIERAGSAQFELRGFMALLGSIAICLMVGAGLMYAGRQRHGPLYRKEAMAVVGLSWMLATVLGGLPYLLSATERSPGQPMNVADALFEAQSGFSTTGATVLTSLEVDVAKVGKNELLYYPVPRCVLFWRSSTHFLGGLGIIVLFVVILGQGSAGKALMRAEMPGPSQDSPQARMQQTAMLLFGVYVGLNALLAALLWFQRLSVFDALCHAFGTMATGGFSTYNASVGHFNSPAVEMIILVFMVAAGSNFMLLYSLLVFKPGNMLADVEWRTYMAVLAVASLAVILVGRWKGDFDSIWESARFGSFQVVSIMTTTGYGTHDFDAWTSFSRGLLFLLMFIGGCAGSTGGGLKVIRHILFIKILWLEIERAYHPSVVRPLRLAGKPLEDQELRRSIIVYFSLILVIFIYSWMALVTLEPDATWHGDEEHKLIDSASAIAATLNNVGPGLGTIGATENYAHFTPWSKLLFTILMMLGRLEVFVIIVLFVPAFWRNQ